ncbi:MAG: sulfatase-like hydrolase/transferase, partial [Methyloceanibacter sp.]
MPPKKAETKVFTQSSSRPWLAPVQSASRAVLGAVAAALTLASMFSPALAEEEIIHDAEYYVLKAQHGDEWAAEDTALRAKLDELKAKHGRPPNIIHIMWDDTAFGDVGIPAIQKVRGLTTPNINRLAEEGILFTRMYTEVGCTPSRAALVTGRHPIRNGMYNIGMLLESHGMRGEEVTMAEVLSKAGYNTA